jgi:hypothetical protein
MSRCTFSPLLRQGGLCDGELLSDSLPREGLARGQGLAPLFPLVWEEGPAAITAERQR